LNKLSQNVILSVSTDILVEDNSVHYFLTYLKLRAICKNYGGNLPNIEFCSKSLELSISTTKRHLCVLKRMGWIRQTENNLQIVSMYKIGSNTEKSKRVSLFEINDELLFQFNWTNIASFKAMLAEMRFEQYSNYQNFRHKQNQKAILIKSSEGYIKPKLSDLASYKKRVRKLNHKYFALSLSSVIIDKSVSTIASYRKKIEPMNLYKTFEAKPVKKSLQRQIDSISGYDVISQLNEISTANRQHIGVTCKKSFGHYYYNHGRIVFQECSKRSETDFLKKCHNNCNKYITNL
jgi:hypothetical protein